MAYTKHLDYALAWHKEAMHIYDKQWRASGYRSTIAHNLYMKHRTRAQTVLRALRKHKGKDSV